MKRWFTGCLGLLGCAFFAQAQDAYHVGLRTYLQTNYGITGGTWVFSDSEVTNAANTTGSGGTKSVITITGQSFTRATQLAISTVPANPWNAGLALNTSQPIANGDRLLLVFWARTSTAPNNIGLGNFTFENNTTFKKDVAFEQRVGTEWKQYLLPFQSTTNQPVGGAKFAVQLGVSVQTIQIAGLTLLNYQQAYPLSALPTQSNDEYVGMETNAPWRVAADARIEQYRKANVEVTVLDANGQPVTNAQVTFEMLRHHYAFGTAINESLIAGNGSQNNTYQNKLLNLDGNGHGFSELVFENGHKWAAWEGNWGLTKAQKAATVKWLADRGVRTRGHNLVWPSWANSPAGLQNYATNLVVLKQQIFNHLDEVLNYPNMGGMITDWDVVNEPTGNVDIANTFRGYAGYDTGREIYVEIFNRVHQVDPSVKKYINEAHLSNFYAKNDVFKAIVQEVVDKGGIIDGVGFQAHIRYFIPPEEMYAHFEEYHQITDGKVKITEYDNKTRAPKWLEASYFRDLLTITFSHPHSDGFLMWGFWDGAHYAGRAPLFDINWNIKPEGQPFLDLVFNKWWTTNTTLTANAAGKVNLRGFKGAYKITVRVGADEFVDTVSLTNDVALTYQQPFPIASVTALFSGGAGSSTAQQYPGIAGDGWTGGWTNTSLVTPGATNTSPLKSGTGNYLTVTRTSGSGSGSQEGVYRQWSESVVPTTNFTRLTFDYRLQPNANFSSAADVYSISLNSVPGASPGGNSTVYIRAFGAATGAMAAREWCVFNGDPGFANGYDIARFRPSGLIAQPGVTYRFTVAIYAGSAAGVSNGKTNGTYDVTITDGTNTVTVINSGFRSAAYSAGGYLAFAMQQDNATDNLAFSVDSIVMTPLLPATSPIILPPYVDGAGQVVLSAATQLGYSYILFITTNLNPPVIWSPVTTNFGTGGTITNTVSVSPQPKQFFRYGVQ